MSLKQLATSNDDGPCAGPPFGKARKFASLEPAFAIIRCNIVNTRYTRKRRRIYFRYFGRSESVFGLTEIVLPPHYEKSPPPPNRYRAQHRLRYIFLLR
jgi:hypothetical protein